ncbi:uncharacterized protein N7518_008318 [Penicillium psychrosexuale]|uniref:uncharacterized protein n=1 Tax=Penicillium psychrosexuale TaxID=1002107 RepID=UPI002545ADEB|nr:uncharacterized protein N7518_008318 [Penicillium psychrosexuale]KAJ5791307.1 hypothetical protein N7518_008318 [Penicillium psychrosexuale]
MENANQTIQMDYSTLSHYCPWQDDRPQPISRYRWPAEEGLQWGSDPSFCYHGFSSPIGTWTEERLVQNLMRNMAGLCTAMDIGFDVPENLDGPTKWKTLRNPIAIFILEPSPNVLFG